MNPCTEDRSIKGVNLIDCILCRKGGKFVKLPGIEILVIPGSKNTLCKEPYKESGLTIALDNFAQFFACLFRVWEQDAIGNFPAGAKPESSEYTLIDIIDTVCNDSDLPIDTIPLLGEKNYVGASVSMF